MKLSKAEVVALIDAIENSLGEPLPHTLEMLRQRATAPDGPFVVRKERDSSGRRMWSLLSTDRSFHIDEYKLPDGKDPSFWFYDKDDAVSACAAVNVMHAQRLDDEKEESQTTVYVCHNCTDTFTTGGAASRHGRRYQHRLVEI